MKLNPVYTYSFALLSMVFWGMSFVWSKIVMQYYEPITTVFLRLVLSSLILFSGLALFGRLQKVKRGDYKLFLVSALLNPFTYFIGENYGLKLTSPTISAIVISTIPLFTPVVAFMVFRERLTRLNIAGLFISFFGVAYMFMNPDLSFNASPQGVLWLSLAVAAAVTYSVCLKKLAAKYNAFMIIAVQNLIGTFYFLPLFLVLDFQHFIQVTPNTELISSLLLLSFFASSLAFVFFTISSREIGISKTNLFTNLIPVFTAIFSFLLLDEQFEARKIIGMIVVIGGVLMSQLNKLNRTVVSARIFNNKGTGG